MEGFHPVFLEGNFMKTGNRRFIFPLAGGIFLTLIAASKGSDVLDDSVLTHPVCSSSIPSKE